MLYGIKKLWAISKNGVCVCVRTISLHMCFVHMYKCMWMSETDAMFLSLWISLLFYLRHDHALRL